MQLPAFRTIDQNLAVAEDAVARLDERLATSSIRDGWCARNHLTDACASLWCDGDLVALEDLVLHDAAADVRTPGHDLVRAHLVLRARRRIAAADPGWSLTPSGLEALRGRADVVPIRQRAGQGDQRDAIAIEDDALAAEFAAIDAAIARSDRVLAHAPLEPARAEPDPLLHDETWDEEDRLQAWRALVAGTATLPPVLAAAIAADAWATRSPLQHQAWLGRLLVPDVLRARKKTRAHMLCLNNGLKAVPRDRRRSRDRDTRISAWVAAIQGAAELGLRDHDRWLLARRQLERKLVGRRSTSKLPQLIELVMATPVVSAAIVAASLGITPRAAQMLVQDLGLRELTGRGRYRAWGVI